MMDFEPLKTAAGRVPFSRLLPMSRYLPVRDELTLRLEDALGNQLTVLQGCYKTVGWAAGKQTVPYSTQNH